MSTKLSPLDILSDLGIDTSGIFLPEESCFLNAGVCCAYTQLVNQGILTTDEATALQGIYNSMQDGGLVQQAQAQFQLSKLRLSRGRRILAEQTDKTLRPLLDLEPADAAE